MPDKPSAKRKPPQKVFKRAGPVSETERDFVTQFVQDQPRAITIGQERTLAKVMRRSPAVVKELVQDARERFVEQAEHYVTIHRRAVDGALESGDYEEARKGSEWYLTHVSGAGERIVDKNADSGPQGTKILVGIRVGGISANDQTVVEMPKPVITVGEAV